MDEEYTCREFAGGSLRHAQWDEVGVFYGKRCERNTITSIPGFVHSESRSLSAISGAYCGHGRTHTENSGLVRSCTDDRAVALPSNDHWFAAQLRSIALLDRSVKRVHVDVDDFSRHQFATVLFRVPVPVRIRQGGLQQRARRFSVGFLMKSILFRKEVNYVPEPSLAERLECARQAVERQTSEMKECEASASAQELAAMQRQHSEYLRIWSGLKLALETEEKRAAIDMRPATGRA